MIVQPEELTILGREVFTIARRARPGVDWEGHASFDVARGELEVRPIHLSLTPAHLPNVTIWSGMLFRDQVYSAVSLDEILSLVRDHFSEIITSHCQNYPGQDIWTRRALSGQTVSPQEYERSLGGSVRRRPDYDDGWGLALAAGGDLNVTGGYGDLRGRIVDRLRDIPRPDYGDTLSSVYSPRIRSVEMTTTVKPPPPPKPLLERLLAGWDPC
jgi:hypothetical protein